MAQWPIPDELPSYECLKEWPTVTNLKKKPHENILEKEESADKLSLSM